MFLTLAAPEKHGFLELIDFIALANQGVLNSSPQAWTFEAVLETSASQPHLVQLVRPFHRKDTSSKRIYVFFSTQANESKVSGCQRVSFLFPNQSNKWKSSQLCIFGFEFVFHVRKFLNLNIGMRMYEGWWYNRSLKGNQLAQPAPIFAQIRMLHNTVKFFKVPWIIVPCRACGLLRLGRHFRASGLGARCIFKHTAVSSFQAFLTKLLRKGSLE